MVGRRWVHDDWDDQPVFLPTRTGRSPTADFFGGSLAGITEKLDYLPVRHHALSEPDL